MSCFYYILTYNILYIWRIYAHADFFQQKENIQGGILGKTTDHDAATVEFARSSSTSSDEKEDCRDTGCQEGYHW